MYSFYICYLANFFFFLPIQHRVTSTVTAVITGVCSMGLVAVCGWFALERWTYTHHQGRKWLPEVIRDKIGKIQRFPPLKWLLLNLTPCLTRTKKSTSKAMSMFAKDAFIQPSVVLPLINPSPPADIPLMENLE
jgi:hypothetical protein